MLATWLKESDSFLASEHNQPYHHVRSTIFRATKMLACLSGIDPVNVFFFAFDTLSRCPKELVPYCLKLKLVWDKIRLNEVIDTFACCQGTLTSCLFSVVRGVAPSKPVMLVVILRNMYKPCTH